MYIGKIADTKLHTYVAQIFQQQIAGTGAARRHYHGRIAGTK
jgi:hypothetical protein